MLGSSVFGLFVIFDSNGIMHFDFSSSHVKFESNNTYFDIYLCIVQRQCPTLSAEFKSNLRFVA